MGHGQRRRRHRPGAGGEVHRAAVAQGLRRSAGRLGRGRRRDRRVRGLASAGPGAVRCGDRRRHRPAEPRRDEEGREAASTAAGEHRPRCRLRRLRDRHDGGGRTAGPTLRPHHAASASAPAPAWWCRAVSCWCSTPSSRAGWAGSSTTCAPSERSDAGQPCSRPPRGPTQPRDERRRDLAVGLVAGEARRRASAPPIATSPRTARTSSNQQHDASTDTGRQRPCTDRDDDHAVDRVPHEPVQPVGAELARCRGAPGWPSSPVRARAVRAHPAPGRPARRRWPPSGAHDGDVHHCGTASTTAPTISSSWRRDDRPPDQ